MCKEKMLTFHTHVCMIVFSVNVFFINLTNGDLLKKKKLLKKLKAKGACLFRQGGGHEVWESKKGSRFMVPRHTEIGEGLAEKILKQADK